MFVIHENEDNDLKKKKEEILPKLLDQILLICKEDKNFKYTKELENYEVIIEATKKKLNKKEELFEQSKEIENKLVSELNELETNNNNKRKKLLKELGSELDD